jgi:hypothetical protein
MALLDDMKKEVEEIFATQWEERDGRVVPDPNDISLENDSVKFDRATILYADLAGSTNLVDTKVWSFAATTKRRD